MYINLKKITKLLGINLKYGLLKLIKMWHLECSLITELVELRASFNDNERRAVRILAKGTCSYEYIRIL